jgi:hypothetical protein
MFDTGQTRSCPDRAWSSNEEAMTSRGRLFWAGASCLLALSCVGGQSGTELAPNIPRCNVTQSRSVAAGEVLDIGTVEELAAEVEQAQSVPMRVFVHEGDRSFFDTTLTLTPSVDRTSGYLVEGPGNSSDDPEACGSVLTVRAVVHFDADDGSFMDVFDGTIEKEPTSTRFSATLPLKEHRGTVDPTTLAKKNYTSPVLEIVTTLGSAPAGRLVLGGSDGDAQQNTSPTSAPIAEW